MLKVSKRELRAHLKGLRTGIGSDGQLIAGRQPADSRQLAQLSGQLLL